MFKRKRNVNGIEKVLLESGLFDALYYLKHNHDARLSDFTPLQHYCEVGIKEDRKPNADFDPAWYREYYSDVKEDGAYPIVHYALFGLNENRLQNETERSEYEKLLEDGFEVEFYKNEYTDLKAFDEGFDFILHFIRYGKHEGRLYTSRAAIQKIKQVVPYEKQKVVSINQFSSEYEEGSVSKDSLSQEELFEYNLLVKKDINFSDYFRGNKHVFISKDPVIDYIKNWRKHKPAIPGLFDTLFYLESYPDIKQAGINPLIHFVQHGKNEGRQGMFDSRCVEKGNLDFDPAKETIVFVSHESSATGAPLLGFGLAKRLSEKYNIVHIVLEKANIHDVFIDTCDLILHDVQQSAYVSSLFFLRQLLESRPVKCVVVNSIIGHEVLKSSHKLNLPTVTLIHEFSDYVRPLSTSMNAVLLSDYVVTPAKIIQDSIMKEFKRLLHHEIVPPNISVYPQGKLPFIPDSYGENDSIDTLYKKLKIDNPQETKVIVGSGYVQIRKGTDLFVAIAKYVKKLYQGECKFVWVGDGFNPDEDLAFSVYLNRELEFSGLKDDFIFLEHQKNLDSIFSIADVFCLSSRMDPFPNVVIDALSHDLHIACFDYGSGSADFLRKHQANATIVDFVDTFEMARLISSYLEEGNRRQGVNRSISRDHLDFDKYVAYIDSLTDQAVNFKTKVKSITDDLLQSDIFDGDFCGGQGDKLEKCRRYVESGLKGIHLYNPKIGFSEVDWLHRYSKDDCNIVPLYEAMISNRIEKHKVVELPVNSKQEPQFRYAVHLHLYYTEMARYFADYFKNLPQGYDLYITIVDSDTVSEVREAFKGCGASKVRIICVKNIGRDIGPFLFALKNEIMNHRYEVIGHFHSKKSLDLEFGGDEWLKYLMVHLIGDVNNAKDVLNLFNDQTVGLVFPEDRNACDIGENRPFVKNLCEMLNLSPIEQTSVFPMGNMFWARIQAIEQLFYLEQEKILQEEPLPYDGSYMHAIERITPFLVQKNGFEYVTVYKKGLAWK